MDEKLYVLQMAPAQLPEIRRAAEGVRGIRVLPAPRQPPDMTTVHFAAETRRAALSYIRKLIRLKWRYLRIDERGG